ncbi:hypothetical protein [Garicola koreensis]|uniref:Leucine rich repeat variant domain-containing protein n=1 Tax=Garicola koreensis TaxID=1262554 RepID=A0A7W5TQ29_9MICC|nr:hypothetical protein [Garicola koreensis]MBB3667635.1 hypothetical protein [Garicola koreensis]
MTENHDAADLEAMASNPHTDWDVLHWIAENHPELRPAVAANPGTYQELVDALGSLGDPDVDAAIAARHRGRDISSETAATNPLAGMYDTASGLIPAYPAEEAGQAEPYAVEPYHAEGPERPAPAPVPYAGPAGHHQQDSAEPGQAAPERAEPVPPEPAEYGTLHYGADPGAADPDEPQPALGAAAHQRHASADQQRQQRRPPLGLIAAAILGVVAVGAAVALLITFLGGDDQTPVAEPEASPTEEAAEESPAEETDGSPEGGQEEETQPAEPDPQETLDEARTALSSLPDESACEADEDSDVVADFIAAGTETEDFPGDDGQLLEDTFDQLQSDCSTTHAASVFTAVRGGTAYQDAAPEGAQVVMDSVGTEWADRAVGTRGAEPVGGFTAQGGNVECEFDDGLTCTVFDTTPQLCEDGATYTMSVEDVGLDCDAQLEPNGYDTLAQGDSATDGFLVCTEMSDRLSCYNSVDPFGFEMSNTGNYAY